MSQYEEWTEQQLKEECARRALKTTGSKDVLVARLEATDELPALSRKRKAVSEEEQAELDKALRIACGEGSLEDVRAALSSGANVNAASAKRNTPLMFACFRDDWSAAEAIVKELLSAGAFLDSCNNEMKMTLHMAARWSSCANVTALLEAKSHVDPRSLNDFTPLHLCCAARDDEEASKIARVLLDRGARLEAVGGSSKLTPLLFACNYGSPEMVELLLSRGADFKAVDMKGLNALMWAAWNTGHGSELIPLLVKAGVDVNAVTVFGATALEFGIGGNAAIMHALAQVFPPGEQLARLGPLQRSPDPIGLCPRGSPVWM
jgi:hypothetical protein